MRSARLRMAVQWLAPIAAGALAVVGVSQILGGDNPPPPLNTGPAPWALPKSAGEHIRAANLPAYKRTDPTAHPHAHLDIFVDGRSVAVPAGLGLVRPYSPLHTHSDSGILHMESVDDDGAFTLSHLFAVWGVRLDASCVGAYCAPDRPAALYVNGKRWAGPIGEARLVPYSEMALVIGTPPPYIPSHYDCHNAADIERTSCQRFLDRSGSSPGGPAEAPTP